MMTIVEADVEVENQHKLLKASGLSSGKRFCKMCGAITEGKDIVAILNPNFDDDSRWMVCKSCADFVAEAQRTVIKELIARAHEKVMKEK